MAEKEFKEPESKNSEPTETIDNNEETIIDDDDEETIIDDDEETITAVNLDLSGSKRSVDGMGDAAGDRPSSRQRTEESIEPDAEEMTDPNW